MYLLLYSNKGFKNREAKEFAQTYRGVYNPSVDLKVTVKWKIAFSTFYLLIFHIII